MLGLQTHAPTLPWHHALHVFNTGSGGQSSVSFHIDKASTFPTDPSPQSHSHMFSVDTSLGALSFKSEHPAVYYVLVTEWPQACLHSSQNVEPFCPPRCRHGLPDCSHASGPCSSFSTKMAFGHLPNANCRCKRFSIEFSWLPGAAPGRKQVQSRGKPSNGARFSATSIPLSEG